MVAERLAAVQRRLVAAAERCGRDAGEIRLVAIGKGHPAAAIGEAYEAGHRDFGENRSDELVSKAARLPGDIRWHFVGSLQSRKASRVLPVTWLLHSMDRQSLAVRWAAAEAPPPVLLQVNVGEEPQKHGVDPGAAGDALAMLTGHGLRVAGLMAIPPAPGDPEDSRPYFRALAALRDGLATAQQPLSELSMGMTDDFEVAVEEGATIVRVGRAIFGPRSD